MGAKRRYDPTNLFRLNPEHPASDQAAWARGDDGCPEIGRLMPSSIGLGGNGETICETRRRSGLYVLLAGLA
jgi:hypothetical protein